MARVDCAVWRPIAANTGGPLAPAGLILHHAVANGSLYTFFANPAAQVSAHFWVAQDGTVEQYVDSEVVAWHGMALNASYCGVETEGCTAPPYADPMSEAMVAGLAAVYAEGAARHGWPNALAEKNGQPGFGYHRMEVATGCPCDVRLARRPDILALAFGIAPPAAASSPPPTTGPAPAAPPWPGRYLKYPPIMQGTDVHTWQAQMAARGWTIEVDGAYGSQSAAVCVAFQDEKGLPVDGVVGPQTWAAAWAAPVT
jgi:N-acetylmuramoyl-L-alanine amidase/Putative peptidoglycan binding domain